MLRNVTLLLLVILGLSLSTSSLAVVNPGVQARITKKGIDYVNTIAQTALNKELRGLKIPDTSGSSGHISYSLTNIRTKGVTLPTSTISLDAPHSGLAWSVSNLGLSLDADWRVKYKKGWVKISDSGSVSVDVKGVTLSVSVHLGEDKNGRPSLATATCNAHISDVDVHFHGGQRIILNLFRHIVEDKIKDALQPQICQVVKKEVDVYGEAKVAKLPVTVELAHKFLLDYRLTSAPKIETTYLDAKFKGEIYWEKDVREPPFPPTVIPQSADVSKMMYIWITEFPANSYLYAGQTHGFLAYNFTASDLPAGNRSVLNTTCQTTMCIGKLIPQIGKVCPNSVVSMALNSTSSPRLSITTQAAVLSASGNIDMYATKPDKTRFFLMTLNMTIDMSLNASVVGERLVAQIVDHRFKIGVVKSNIGNIHPQGLNLILGLALDTTVIPHLNAIGKKGFQLPVTDDVKFVNTSLQLLNGSVVVSTDIASAKRNVLRFVPEVHVV